jgi:hypothetical protein
MGISRSKPAREPEPEPEPKEKPKVKVVVPPKVKVVVPPLFDPPPTAARTRCTAVSPRFLPFSSHKQKGKSPDLISIAGRTIWHSFDII